MAASWLSSQERTARGRHSQGIRKYIKVHGKVVKPPSQGLPAFEEEDDDFSTQPRSQSLSAHHLAKPTKQLTLSHFKKKLPEGAHCVDSDSPKPEGERKNVDDRSNLDSLFLPALKLSTGVRRKVKKEEMNKENVPVQETKSKTTMKSPLRGVQHKPPRSIPHRKGERYRPVSLSVSQSQPHTRSSGQREKEVTTIESSHDFLSSRKGTIQPKANQWVGEATSERTSGLCDLEASPGGRLDLGPLCEVKPREEGQGETTVDCDSDLYINTNQLLDELSNCERILL